MKANQLATLVLRLMGIYCLIQVITEISLFISAVFTGLGRDDTLWVIRVLAISGVYILVGILLITHSEPLGEKLVPKEMSDQIVSPISFKQVQVLAFAISGILIFAGALPELFISIFGLLHSLSSENRQMDPAHINPNMIEYWIGTLLRTALGIWLFFGADGFANFFSSMRNFATPKPPPAQ